MTHRPFHSCDPFSQLNSDNALAKAFWGRRRSKCWRKTEPQRTHGGNYGCFYSLRAKPVGFRAHDPGIAFGAPLSARANVITDWDETAVAVVMPMPPYTAQRLMGMVHVAMFDAVNSIERRYRPYLAQLTADPAMSKEAAAAAATVLATIDAKTAGDMKAALSNYLRLKIGEYVVNTVMQPVEISSR